LIAERVNTVLARELGEGPFHVLRDGLVEIYNRPSASGIKEALEDFLDGKLEKLYRLRKNLYSRSDKQLPLICFVQGR
jgi:predicted Fe-Mo cluster-binding NifX family protein